MELDTEEEQTSHFEIAHSFGENIGEAASRFPPKALEVTASA